MCDLLNKDPIELKEYAGVFEVERFVYIPDFIRNGARLKILESITATEHLHKKVNRNTIWDALGQLNARHNTSKDTIIKKHSVITGTDIQRHYPQLHYYYHNCFADTVSRLVGTRVYPVNEIGSTNNALFIYEQAGDSLRWHTDGSLFNGKKVFTLLVYLHNSSTQELCYISHDKQQRCMYTAENACVVLEHFTLEHAVTPLKHNEKKIMWTMTFAEDMNISNPLSYVINKVKNISYLGWGAISRTDLVVVILLVLLLIRPRRACPGM